MNGFARHLKLAHRWPAPLAMVALVQSRERATRLRVAGILLPDVSAPVTERAPALLEAMSPAQQPPADRSFVALATRCSVRDASFGTPVGPSGPTPPALRSALGTAHANAAQRREGVVMATSSTAYLDEGSTSQPLMAAVMLRRGVSRVAALRAASAGLARAPSLDERAATLERAQHELLELEYCAVAYEHATGKDLLAEAERALIDVPLPDSWLEVCLARLLMCLAARTELEFRATERASHGSELLVSLAHEVEHVNAARAALQEIADLARRMRELAAEFMPRWLDLASASFADADVKAHYLAALQRELDGLGLGAAN